MFLLIGGIEGASTQVPPSGELEEFDYTVRNVKPLEFPSVLYSTARPAPPVASLQSSPAPFSKLRSLPMRGMSFLWTLER